MLSNFPVTVDELKIIPFVRLYYNDLALFHAYICNYLADNSDMQEPPIPTFSQLRHLHILTLVIEGLGGPVDVVIEILNDIPTTGALEYLNIVVSWNILTPLTFNSINASNHRSLKTLEQSIIRFKSLSQVVFTPPYLRRNRRGLWESALDRVFSLLKENGTLSKDTDAHCKCYACLVLNFFYYC